MSIAKKCLFLCVLCITSYVHTVNICVLGTGYVGLVTGVGLACVGHNVCCVDIISEKISQLNAGKLPIYEPGLAELMQEPVKAGRLLFSTDIKEQAKKADIVFIAVGTPMGEDGSADLKALETAITNLADTITQYKVICVKSTVPVGSCRRSEQQLLQKGVSPELFDIVSNPEFLREGTAVSDFMKPDRIVVGGTPRALAVMRTVYQPFIDKGYGYLETQRESSELIKYASNAMLATRIVFIDEIARLCNQVGADVRDVAKGMGMDKRIGPAFLQPGPGFGGSCFPKDTKALDYMVKRYRIGAKIIPAIFKSNTAHKEKNLRKIEKLLGGDCHNKTIALLGLTFKANTDDIRDSFSLDAIKFFTERGAIVNAYDPQGMENTRKIFPGTNSSTPSTRPQEPSPLVLSLSKDTSEIHYCTSALDAIQDADAIIIATEWDEFKNLDLSQCAQKCRTKIVADLRNLFDVQQFKNTGFAYCNLGRQI